jgi:hypothetical protein
MRLENPFHDMQIGALFETLLPDFVLAFAFFTSICYAVLGKRFGQQRSAIAMSAAIGFALAVGLVWWEEANNFSIRNLGAIAIGFAIIVLALVIYQSIKQIGGSWAGAGISLGVTIIIAKLLQPNIPIHSEIIRTITVVAFIAGMLAFLSHTRNQTTLSPRVSTKVPDIRHDMSDLYQGQHLSDQLTRKMRNLRKKTKTLTDRPQDAGNVLLQLRRMLPAEGYLTERMAQLRAKAHRVRHGHIAALEETGHLFASLPVSAKKKAAAELAARYNQLIDMDTRLERLDKAVAENEYRIKELTYQAQQYTASYDHRRLSEALKAAEKLQHHNSRLFKTIERTENKLAAVAKKVAQEARQVDST